MKKSELRNYTGSWLGDGIFEFVYKGKVKDMPDKVLDYWVKYILDRGGKSLITVSNGVVLWQNIKFEGWKALFYEYEFRKKIYTRKILHLMGNYSES